MADGLTTQTTTLATIPGSSKIATDDTGAAGHVQIVKLAISTDGSVTLLPGDATDGLLVNLGPNNDVTVDGTVTVDGSGVTQPVSHAALTELAAAIDTEVQVDIVSSALPSGASTSAKQDTVIGHLDGVEGLLTTIDADTGVLSAGWSVKNCTSGDGSTALTNSAQEIKASAGKLGGWYIYNPNSSAAYVPIYNVAAASVTVGTTNPVMVLTIPATSAANLLGTAGLTFGTAISAAAASTAGGNGAPTSALEANFFFA